MLCSFTLARDLQFCLAGISLILIRLVFPNGNEIVVFCSISLDFEGCLIKLDYGTQEKQGQK